MPWGYSLLYKEGKNAMNNIEYLVSWNSIRCWAPGAIRVEGFSFS